MEKGREAADSYGWFRYYPSEIEKVYFLGSTIKEFIYEYTDNLKFNLEPAIDTLLMAWINPDGSVLSFFFFFWIKIVINYETLY